MVLKANQIEKQLGWKVLNAIASAVVRRRDSALTCHHMATSGWWNAPEGPADQNVTLGAALTWAIAMGVGVAVSRLIAIRLAVDVWEAAVHEEPPALG